MEQQLYVLNVKMSPLKPDLFHISCRSRKLISHKNSANFLWQTVSHFTVRTNANICLHQCGIFFGPFFIAPVCYFNSLVCTDKLQKSHQIDIFVPSIYFGVIRPSSYKICFIIFDKRISKALKIST